MNYPYYLKEKALNRHLKVIGEGEFWHVQVFSTQNMYHVEFGRQRLSTELFENIISDYEPSTETEYLNAIKWYFYEQRDNRDKFIAKYGK
jgi:hypothetical protein